MIETVKLAEDGSDDVIVRLYEAHGTRATATIGTTFPHSGAIETDLLERETPAAAVAGATESGITVALRPFQLVTLRFAR